MLLVTAPVLGQPAEGSGDPVVEDSPPANVSLNPASMLASFTAPGRIDTEVRLNLDVSDAISAPFFAHESFGFDAETFRALARDPSAWVSSVVRYVQDVAASPRPVVVATSASWGLVLVLAILALYCDRRLRRWFEGFAHELSEARPSKRRWLDATRRGVIRSGGRLVIPTAAWMLSYVPIQGVFDSAPWTRALSQGLGLFIIYRLVVTAIEELLSGDFFDAPEEAARTVRRVGIVSARLVFVFAVATDTIATVGYREDVHALSLTLLRASITLLGLRVIGARRHIAALLPAEGSKRYLRFRDVASRGLTWLLWFSILLLALWTLGFQRAATTILLRSYGVIGLLTAGALAQRWFDRAVERAQPSDDSLSGALIRQVDSFARACIYGAFGIALLRLLGVWSPLIDALTALHVSFGDSPITALNVVRAVIVIVVAVLVSRVVRVVLGQVVYPWLEVDVGSAYATDTAIHYFVIAISFGGALIALGIDVRALTVFVGALGVGIGFGLQDFAKNLAGGFTLLFGRTIEKGDLISVDDAYYGHVEEIGARIVKVRTRDNYDLLVPSSKMVSSTITNWTHNNDPHVRLHISVGVAYGSDVNEVREALLAAAERLSFRYAGKPADVWFKQFGESSIDFELLVWIDATRVDPGQARGKALFPIWEVLKERGIEIPFPQRDLHIRSVYPDAEDALTRTMSGRERPKPPTTGDDDEPAPA